MYTWLVLHKQTSDVFLLDAIAIVVFMRNGAFNQARDCDDQQNYAENL